MRSAPAASEPTPSPAPRGPIAFLLAFPAGFSRGFWTFFAAAFCFDFGFGLFFFLFNLYLTDLHYNEKVLGILTGALTLGNVVGTIPVMILARRYGLQKMLLLCFIAAPLLSFLRTFILFESAQTALAFFTGVFLSSWPICFSPAIAALTNDRNRVRGFSITFATGIGLGTLAGIAGGYLPDWLRHAGHSDALLGSMRTVLQLACCIALLGVWPVYRLRLGTVARNAQRRIRIFHPLLFWFLPPFVVWNIVTGSFTPFASVYLQQHLGIPLPHVGLIFSGSQLLQFTAVLLAPLLYRKWGRIVGVGLAQAATAVALVCIALTRDTTLSVAWFLAFSGAQWMTGPGIYSLLMDNIPVEERSTASAIQNLSGAICQAATAAATGACIVRFGYADVLFGNAAVAMLASILFVLLLRHATREHSSYSLDSQVAGADFASAPASE